MTTKSGSSTTQQRRRSLVSNCDVLIIGGGIVGAGVARDAAQRGWKTVLVEQGDFASGTSSRSSRLLHGGLRYLAQGHVGLVREASVEKMRLSQIAPHLCDPLPFLFPVWRGSGWSLWQLSWGVWIYDLLCDGRNLGRSKTLDSQTTANLLPGLQQHNLLGATRHFDALTNDARLVLDTLRTAERAGAIVRNYTPFVNATPTSAAWQCEVHDELTSESFSVQAKVVINAAGAWGARIPHSQVQLRLTKGVHLVIDRQRMKVDEAVVLTEGKRILFVIPWGERIILGTTDTDYEGDPAEVHTRPPDVDYVLAVVNQNFPAAQLTRADVLATWAGVRPLVAPKQVKRGAPSDISRSHVIHMAEPGWFDVAGGKLTTYRLMAEQAIDRAEMYLHRRHVNSQTAMRKLEAGPFSGVLPPAVAREVVTECCQREWAIHLDDVLIRRTSWHYYHAGNAAMVEQVAGWIAEELEWTDEQLGFELERYWALTGMEQVS